MPTLQTRLETAANFATVVTCVCIVGVLATRYFPPTTAGAGSIRLQAGDKVSLDADWKRAGTTLLLALNKECSYCTASMPFYRRLVASPSKVPVVAVFPHDTDEAKNYLKQHDVRIADVRQADFTALHVHGTPTIALIDRDGIVTKTWNGQLDPNREAEVLAAIGLPRR